MIVKCEANPAIYMPFITGAYRVEAGLYPLSHTFGNGAADGYVFQFDSGFQRFSDNGKRARSEDLDKYCCAGGLADEVERATVSFIMQRLVAEHPAHFQMDKTTGGVSLECRATGETLQFNQEFQFDDGGAEGYVSALDALAAQVQEDLAIVQLSEEGDRLVAVHAVAPGGWDPREKIGKSFQEIHAPVAEIENLAGKAQALLQNIVKGGRYQRYVWGLSPDTELNHHPENAAPLNFDAGAPSLFVRVERQVLIGFDSVSSFLFCIHPYFLDCATLSLEHRHALRKAMQTMTEASRAYKGLAESFDDIIEWLTEE